MYRVIQPLFLRSRDICHTGESFFTSSPAPPILAQVSSGHVSEVQESLRSNHNGSKPLGMIDFFFFFKSS